MDGDLLLCCCDRRDDDGSAFEFKLKKFGTGGMGITCEILLRYYYIE
jgi:hypothetical protein